MSVSVCVCMHEGYLVGGSPLVLPQNRFSSRSSSEQVLLEDGHEVTLEVDVYGVCHLSRRQRGGEKVV